ncbi:MAG: insulinase family protein, partial [Bacteroidales bacterium]|nr:insulinase family protein [Bacteroidales bacterium]
MKRIYSIISLLLILFSASAQVDPQAPLQRDTNVKYGKLADGMTYYIVRNSQPAERAEYYLLTDVGAIQENENQKGLAHFLEHMCLNGTKNLPGKMMLDYFQSIGASFGGNINASTGTEQTIYMLNNIPTTRPGMIDTALLILHDYSAYVTNDPAEIDKERGVIVEEWRTRRTSDWRMMEELYKYLYKGSKYADCNIIGTKEGLETFPAAELQNFYKTWYHPANQAIVVVGDIDPDEIVAKLEALFVDVPAKENPQEKEQYLIPSNSEPIVGIITDAEARNTEVMMVLKGEPMPKEYMALGMSYLNDLVEGLVSIMFSERFNDIAMRVDAPFLNAAVAFEDPTKACHAFLLDIISKDGASIEAFRAALTEVEKAKRYGFTQEEFNRASAIILQSLESAVVGKETRKNAEFISQLAEDFFKGRPIMDPEYELQQAEGYLQLLNVDAINMAFTQLTNYDKDVVVAYMAPEREGLVHPSEQDFVSVINEVKTADIDRNAAEEAIGGLLDADSVVGSAVVDTKPGIYNSTVWQLANGIKVIVRPSDYAADEVCMRLRIFGGESIVDEQDLPSISSDIFGTFLPMAGVAEFPYITLSKQLAGKNVSIQPVINQYSNGFEG